MEQRTTAQQLEEFRRRKAKELEMAKPKASVTSIEKKTSPTPPPAVDTIATNADGVKKETCDNQEQRDHMPVWWTSLSTWMYNAVMPDHVLKIPSNIRPFHTADNLSGPEDSETDDVDLADENLASSSHVPLTTSQRVRLFLQSVYVWWIMAWICGWALAIRFGWGAVYFSLSVLLVIWKSLERSRRRKRGERSAYSVFNENCERIEGTLDAEQLQRTMFLGI